MRTDITDFGLADMYEDLERQFAPLAARRGLRLRVTRPDCHVHSDRVLLRRVLQNLISNALRYTRQGGVLVGCQRRGRHFDLCVWDTGPGIPEAHQRAIFDEFRRLDGPSPWGDKGLGLGLSICDRIARLLGLELSLRSTPGRGSVFRVRVPVGSAPTAGTLAPAATQPATAPSSLVGLKVLCVDNEPEILTGMSALMTRWGVDVATAAGAAEARAAAGREHPAVVLADYRLADGDPDGLDLLVELCTASSTALPGALVTADHSPALARRAREQGFPLLRKPVKPAALRALLGALAAQRSGNGH
jgi:CheY-like chemotaxis protein/anti-sigma regulatory factor (Ser/Thr protein kinase)